MEFVDDGPFPMDGALPDGAVAVQFWFVVVDEVSVPTASSYPIIVLEMVPEI